MLLLIGVGLGVALFEAAAVLMSTVLCGHNHRLRQARRGRGHGGSSGGDDGGCGDGGGCGGCGGD